MRSKRRRQRSRATWFANGDALVKMAPVKVGGRWMINGFHVETLGRLTASRA